MTGHLVLTTLHAQTAASSIQRLTDMNIERSILATSINCIIGQRLARRVCKSCCVAGRRRIPSCCRALACRRTPGELRSSSAVGCPECGNTGYRGRVPLFEVMTMTDEIALLVGAPSREIEAMAVSQGMVDLREDGVRLASTGITTLEEVRRVAGETRHGGRRSRWPRGPEAIVSGRRCQSVELRDRHALAAFLRRNAPAHVYELGDLDDFDWPFTRWFGWEDGGALEQVALLYTQPSVPVLIAIAEEPDADRWWRCCAAIRPTLPPTHLRPRVAAAARGLRARYVVEDAEPHLKLALDAGRPARGDALRGRVTRGERLAELERSTGRPIRRRGSRRGCSRRGGTSASGATDASPASPASTSTRRGGAPRRSATSRRCRSSAARASRGVRARRCACSSSGTGSRRSP